ncbi:homoserine O-succinyltransferase [Kamptonema cortianum]|jgi:GMP synthase (glutamine-hydrolysing)|nr:homoserine O-succinyltransferase [Geitlerinema splendidum]MDK3160842.1 homoserine O-succinyltransferase [Kamptonema cortianum]
MNILCITHADFETPGVIEDWAKERGYGFKICRPYQGENCLSATVFDFLIVMGGPQSPLELEKDPYLKDEITLITQAISRGKIVLGFCLGAQLIGEALGGKTTRSPEKEVGVYPLSLTEEGLNDPLLKGFPKSFSAIHWHNDMPGETKGSVILAFSQGCPRQALRYAPKVYGFQCHLEITKEGIQEMIKACPGDLKPSRFTQTPDELLEQDYSTINQLMIKILDRLVALESTVEGIAVA